MRYPSAILLFLGANFAIGLAPISFAQNSGSPLPTITRLVKNFSVLESEWMEAVRKRDGVALDHMLADDFEMRIGNEPGRPIPREDWIKQSLKDTPFSSSTEQMAVHDLGNAALVSFLWKLDAPKSGEYPRQLFVVDTWELEGGTWRAKVRYVAPTVGPDMRIPGVAQTNNVIEKKY